MCGGSFCVTDVLHGSNVLQVAICVLKVDSQQELAHYQAQVHPQSLSHIELIFCCVRAENPNAKAARRGARYG